MTTLATETIEQTIEFAIEHKLSVFPLTNKKLPMVKWRPYQTSRAGIREMSKWIETEAKGMAMVTGSVNGIVVLDIDVKKGKDGWKFIKDKHLPKTPAVRTQNGGTHYYYKYPQGMEIGSVIGLYGKESGIDVKANGGFVVMPFTEGYEWEEGLELGTEPLADLPEWLLHDLQNRPNKKPEQASKIINTGEKVRSKPEKALNYPEMYKNTTATGERIKGYFKDNEVVMKILPLLGLEGVEINGASFNCVIPSKTVDTRPSASLFELTDGTIAYRDWRASEGEADYYMLAEVYASIRYKEKRKLNGPELITWSNRLLVDAGILAITPVEAPELPLSLSKKKAINAVYEGFKQLLAVKNLYLESNRTAFSFRFGAAWCGLSLRSVQNAMTQLQAFGYIQMVGKEGVGIRAVNVYQLNKQKP